MLKPERDKNDKRDFYRLEVETELTFRVPSDGTEHKGSCSDLSHTGIQFDTEQELSKGQSLEVTIDSKNGKFEPMQATVEVVRIESADNKYSVGCKILEFK